MFRRSYKQSLQHYLLDFGAKRPHGRYASRGEAQSIRLQMYKHDGLFADPDPGHNGIREKRDLVFRIQDELQ